MNTLAPLRAQIDVLNLELLALLNRRIEVARKIRDQKRLLGQPVYDPERELEMIAALVQANPGPFPSAAVAHLFSEVARATVEHLEGTERRSLLVHRKPGEADRSFAVGAHRLGEGPVLVAGPCSVEDEEQIFATAKFLAPLGRAALAAGAQGVMLEVHPRPGIARSDAQQQLDFKAFDAFLSALGRPLQGLDARAPTTP